MRKFAWAVAFTLTAVHETAALGEIVPDANTIVLDHFNGTTTGSAFGALLFAPSLSGLGQAGVFGPGNYVRYTMAASSAGTMEMWIRPNSLAISDYNGLLNVNWGLAASYPPAGHVVHFSINPASPSPGSLLLASFWPSGHAFGTASIAALTWTHVAFSWGPAGTKAYVNGIPSSGVSGAPSLLTTNYAYLNYWGSTVSGQVPFDGLIDEVHISNVQRSDAEIAAHATVVVDVEIDIKPGSDPNCFNNDGNGAIPVAILSSGDFDATEVDPMTVSLDGQAVRIVGKKGTAQAHVEDVNGDDLDDLVLQIQDQDGTYSPGDTTATLTGETFDGTKIQGTDSICIVR